MIKAIVVASLCLTSVSLIAGPECTKEPKSKWKDQAKFQEELKAKGYEIKKFKVTSGNCYEIYGHKDKQKVEIYFNPVSGEIAKEIKE